MPDYCAKRVFLLWSLLKMLSVLLSFFILFLEIWLLGACPLRFGRGGSVSVMRLDVEG